MKITERIYKKIIEIQKEGFNPTKIILGFDEFYQLSTDAIIYQTLFVTDVSSFTTVYKFMGIPITRSKRLRYLCVISNKPKLCVISNKPKEVFPKYYTKYNKFNGF